MNAGYAKYGTRPDLAFPKNQFGTADKPTAVALQWYLHTGADEGSAITVRWGNKAPTRFKLRIHCSNYGASGKRNAMLSDGAGCGTGCANATRKGAPS